LIIDPPLVPFFDIKETRTTEKQHATKWFMRGIEEAEK
jgi:hypothetical protein